MIQLKFELYPEDGLIKPYNHPYGYIFRAVIMKWLSEIKPEIVHELHSYEKIRPYSIRSFINNNVPKIDFFLTSYFDTLNNAILNDLLTREKEKFKIGQKYYYISKVEFEKIYLHQIIEKSKPVLNFNLNFITPTYFNTNRGDYPLRFPIPEISFRNLTNIWNDVSKKTSEIDRDQFIDWINAHVYISAYKMRTARAEIGKSRTMIGGIGNVSYQVKKMNKVYYNHYLEEIQQINNFEFIKNNYFNNCKWLEILCRFGEYTNVGANRTAGLGVIKYYPKNYFNK
jgi:hypothetical protein